MSTYIKSQAVLGRVGRSTPRWTSWNHGLIARLFSRDAERWGRRALFYERHREYFPRLASGRFVARCRELEAMYQRLSRAVWNIAPQCNWAWMRPIVAGRLISLMSANHMLLVTLSGQATCKAWTGNRNRAERACAKWWIASE